MIDRPRRAEMWNRLLSALRRRLCAPDRARLQRAEAASAAARAAVERWKSEAKALRLRRGELRAVRAALARERDKAEGLRHHALSPRVVRHVLGVRTAARRARRPDPMAIERDQALRRASVSYREAIEQASRDAPAGIVKVAIDGVPWWLPNVASERLTKLTQQGFPFRAILQSREVSPGFVMLDVGANVGRTSIPRVLLGDVQVVYAAEPDPDNFAALVQNVVQHGLTGYVLPDRTAVGAAEGTARLRRSQFIGGHRVSLEAGGEGAPGTFPVPIVTLDRWVERLAIDPLHISFVKIDTQGWDYQVLLGASKLLAHRHVAWQIEVDPGLLRKADTSPADLFALLASRFTHVIEINSGGRGPRLRPVGRLERDLSPLFERGGKTDLILLNSSLEAEGESLRD